MASMAAVGEELPSVPPGWYRIVMLGVTAIFAIGAIAGFTGLLKGVALAIPLLIAALLLAGTSIWVMSRPNQQSGRPLPEGR